MFCSVLNRKHSYKEKKFKMFRDLLKRCETSFPGEIMPWFNLNLWPEFDRLTHFTGAFGA